MSILLVLVGLGSEISRQSFSFIYLGSFLCLSSYKERVHNVPLWVACSVFHNLMLDIDVHISYLLLCSKPLHNSGPSDHPI